MNILSFDVEDWYMSYDSSQIPVGQWASLESRIRPNITSILLFLRQHQVKATFFIMGWVAEHNPDVVRQLASEGHEIGYHSYLHELPAKQGPVLFEEDLIRGLSLLERLTGQKITQYRAPRFSLSAQTAWAIPVLLKHGIQLSSSMKSGRDLNGKHVPDVPFYLEYKGHHLLELPLNQASTLGFRWVYTGSGYFRLLPFSLLKRLYHQHSYNMAYFHPRDFDLKVPSTPLLPFYRNIMCRLGNKSTVPKLSALMQESAFIPLGEAKAMVMNQHADLQRIRLG